MITLHIFLIALMAKMCHTEFVQVLNPFNPLSPPLLPMCQPTEYYQPIMVPSPFQPLLENTTSLEQPKNDLQFLVPFLDMEIQYDRSLHVMQEVQKQQLYILHGHELYQLFISHLEKRLSLVAVLEGSVRHVDPLAAEVIFWQGNLLLVIALEEHLEVYQLAEDILIRRAEALKDPARFHEPAPIFEAIQQLTLTGRFQKLFLFSPNEERVMIVAAVNFTKLYGKLRIFEWFNTYFDPIEEMTVPSIQVVNIIGSGTKYLVTGRSIRHQARTILSVYEISPTSLKIQPKQTLTVESSVVHIFSYLKHNIIVACSSKQQSCSSLRQMPDGQFRVYRRRTANELTFDFMASSLKFVTAVRQNRVMAFTNHRLDCYASFISDQIDLTGLVAYQNAYKEDYVLLVYKRPFKTLVRIVELEINATDLYSRKQSEPEEIQVSTTHEHLFESTIGHLRSALLKRKVDMDTFRKTSQALRPNLKKLSLKERVVLQAGKVDVIKITGKSLKSPKQILQSIEVLKQNYLPPRSKRSETKDFLNASTEVTNRVKVKRLRVENLIYHGEIIKGFSLNQTNLEEKILNIKPKIITHSLNTSELMLPPKEREVRQQTVPDLSFNLISHLKVNFINGVDWNVFYNSLFLKNRDKSIEGRLILQSQVKVNNLSATILNGLTVSNLFNLKLPQVIHSHMQISKLYVHDLNAETVNGLIFEKDIVFSGNDTFIETPVKMHHLVIAGDLQLPNNTNLQHGIEFKQFYSNKVIINGSLIVNNLKRLNNATKIMLGDLEFDPEEIKEKYLLKKQAQNFSFPVVFDEANVTVPALLTNYLNDHQTEQHLLVHTVLREKPLLALFMNAHVQGDIICRDYYSKIVEIKENIIRAGEKVNITGIKVFEALLEVNSLQVSSLNEMPVSDLVFKTLAKDNETVKFKDCKMFSAIKIKNLAFIDQELKASYLNNLPLESLLNNDYYMESLHVPHLVATSNLVFHRINGIHFDEFFTKLDVKEERLVLHKDLIVEGSVQFAENLQINYINDVSWNEYKDNLVNTSEQASVVVEGNVVFMHDLTINEKFEACDINGYDLNNILKNVLMKNKPQLITGLYSFDNIKGSNIDVWNINETPVSEFIDLRETLTIIEGDVEVESLNVGGSLQGNLLGWESLFFVEEQVKQLPLKSWKCLYVLNNASWPAHIKHNDQHELLKYLYKSAVRRDKDQIVTGNVNMNRPSVKNMSTRFKFPPQLDIDFMRQDALLKNSSLKQIVKAEKVFTAPLNVQSLQVKGNLNTKFLNGIDVRRFNQSLYRLHSQEPLKGPFKFLKPLQVGQLQVNGLVNGLNTTLIYQLEPKAAMPSIELKELYIENDLFIKNINDMSLEYFLDNRVTLKGPALEHFGALTFEHLVVEKEALLQSINGIAIDNLVFKHSPYLQTITGHKSLQHSLELDGPAHVMHINDKDFTELYRTSLRKDHNYEFHNLFLEEATFEGGLQMAINSNSNLYRERSFADNEFSPANNKEEFLKFLKEFKDNLSNAPKDIIYLDYDLSTHIKWLEAQEPSLSNRTIFHTMDRVSCCEKQYIQISFVHPNNFYLKNITSNRLTKISNKISVKAENYCRFRKRKVKSKITISGKNLLKVFAMKRYMETIYTLQFVNTMEYFVVLHVLDLPSLKRNEVRIFKISSRNNSITEWQGLTQSIGQHLKLYRLSNLIVMLTNGLINHLPGVTIYNFDSNSQLFKMQQIIIGDYDIMEMIELPNKKTTKQLILSCSKCQRIFIYELNSSEDSGKYEIFQIITLKSPIDKLLIFHLNNDFYMLVISQPDSNFYHIYKYAYVQGWRHLTFGYFPNLQMSIPITELRTEDETLKSDGIPLVLLCNHDNCYLVKAIVV